MADDCSQNTFISAQVRLSLKVKDFHLRCQHTSLKLMVGWFLVFNATFSNISAISWRPVLVMEEA
jgi:hypothetical protein